MWREERDDLWMKEGEGGIKRRRFMLREDVMVSNSIVRQVYYVKVGKDMHVCTWCAHGVHMTCTWCANGVHMVCTWCAHDVHMVCT